jgi:hypothetical protein
MKTTIRLVVGALALAALVRGALRAADLNPPRETGHVLVLDNERVIEGDIAREGDRYRVRRHVGETLVPADNVLCLCDTLEDAYDYLKARTNLRDADERVRLARWCQLHGLRSQALAEVTAAAELRPTSAECQRLLQSMQRVAASAAAPPAPRPRGEGAAEPAGPPPVEVSADSLGQFISRVQPVLMNACASCHVAGRGGSFKLVRACEGTLVSRRASQQNLSAVLAQINREHWEASLFLIKAVSLHGEASQPPLKSRQAPAFRHLEDWVRATLADNPQLQEHAPTTVVAAPLRERTPVEPLAPKIERPAGEGFGSVRPAGLVTPAGGGPTTATATKPLDPFDPVLFNRGRRPAGQ